MAAQSFDAAPFRATARIRRWPVVLTIVLLLSGLSIGASAFITVPYYALSPGQVVEVGDFIVTDAETFRPKGDLMFLTVSVREVTPFEWLESQLDPEVHLIARDVVRPEGVTREERRRRGLDQQAESERNAVFVALTTVGLEPEINGGGALVATVVDESPAEGTLALDDVIVAIDGRAVSVPADLTTALADSSPGDEITLTVRRVDQEGGDDLVLDVTLVLGTNPDDPNRGFIGVALGVFEFEADFGFMVEIDSQNIGGPSAGMMYTLGIIDAFTEADLTKGHRIAGTGTIRLDRSVGAIGGAEQKVYAARDAGAEYVLVPEANFEEAAAAAEDGAIEIIPIATVDDALTFLDSLEPVG